MSNADDRPYFTLDALLGVLFFAALIGAWLFIGVEVGR